MRRPSSHLSFFWRVKRISVFGPLNFIKDTGNAGRNDWSGDKCSRTRLFSRVGLNDGGSSERSGGYTVRTGVCPGDG